MVMPFKERREEYKMTMTTQDIFNKSVLGVVKQGKQSGEGQTCSYRTGDLKCVVGHLIDDEHYNTDLEGYGFNNDQVLSAVEKSIGRDISGDENCLLGDLQDLHDFKPPDIKTSDADFIDYFKITSAIVAKKYSLTMPEFES